MAKTAYYRIPNYHEKSHQIQQKNCSYSPIFSDLNFNFLSILKSVTWPIHDDDLDFFRWGHPFEYFSRKTPQKCRLILLKRKFRDQSIFFSFFYPSYYIKCTLKIPSLVNPWRGGAESELSGVTILMVDFSGERIDIWHARY